MKHYLSFIFIAFVFVTGHGQDRITDDPITAYMFPGKVHSLLATYAGDWMVEMKSSMGANTLTNTAPLEGRSVMILGGRFLQITISGKLSGSSFEEMITLGYDNTRGVFQMMSFTNLGTVMIYTEGGWDSSAKLATLTGKISHPYVTSPIEVRKVISMASPEKLVIENFDTLEGKKEQKTWEIILIRKK